MEPLQYPADNGRKQNNTEKQLMQQLADYAMALDLQSQITHAAGETEAVNHIIHLCQALFAPRSVSFLLWTVSSCLLWGDSSQGRLISSAPSDMHDTIEQRLAGFSGTYERLPAGNGFRLLIRYEEKQLGILDVEGLCFPEHCDHYLNLTLSLAGVWGLAIENARRFQQIAEQKNQLLETLNVLQQTQLQLADKNQRLKQEIIDREAVETEKKHLEKMKSLGTMAGGFAHDFNNILSGVVGFTELALEDATPGSTMEDNLLEACRGSMRARDLVHKFLTFAGRIDETRIPLSPFPVICQVLEKLQPSLPPAIEIRKRCESRAKVLASPFQIEQLITHLATNAIDAMQARGGMLEIKLTDFHSDGQSDKASDGIQAGDYLLLTVSDTGSGITPEIMEKLYDPYFTTKPFGEGSGIGLSVVYGIVRNLGGEIAVDSQPGNGCVFRLCLPVCHSSGKTGPISER